ncbi:MAG TPA: MoaD/ThiS family protein [Methylomirabilota bacterium]|nr:MoaD/ThiS family protein [Methylomirabilota bacterium]
MNVKVQYFAIVREMVGLRDEVLNLTHGTTVLDLLKLIVTNHTQLKDYLFDPKTSLPRSNLQFLVDDNLISALKGFETPMTRDCTFAIIPPVGGG